MDPAKHGWWLTAIPMAYGENPGFWDRDAGLICLGLRELGFDARFVAWGEPGVREDVPLILARPSQMEDPAWWKQWGAEGVVFYSWGIPEHEPVARAIKASGAKLCVRLDSDGVLSPHVMFWSFWGKVYCAFRDKGKALAALLALAKTALYFIVPSFYEAKIFQHLDHADVVAIESPLAKQRFCRLVRKLHRVDLADKIRVIAHPVAGYFALDPRVVKQPKIIAVGRWESHFKDAPMLVRTLGRVLATEPDHSAEIIGSGAHLVQRLIAELPPTVQARIKVPGRVPHRELNQYYNASRIILVTSRHESFHIAAAEALCCGCSVVGPVNISSMNYFISEASGTVAVRRTVDDFVDALNCEIDMWRTGRRNPQAIGRVWRQRFSATAVAEELHAALS